MSEEKDKSKFEQEREKAEWRQQTQQEIIAELRSNPAFMQEFDQYDEAQVNIFLENYAKNKVSVLEWGERYIEWQEKEDLHWVEDAFERIKEIQQKKLFDTQCLWRAERLLIEEIHITDDFYYWEKNILSCPFIDPATPEDIEIYHRYLTSNNFEHHQVFFHRWQDYKAVKAAFDKEDDISHFPEWYDFHNGFTGKGVLLTLPDIRGEKENYYIRLALKEERKKIPQEEVAVKAAPVLQPDISYTMPGFTEWFVNTFDTKETQQHFNDFGGDNIWGGSEKNEVEEQAREYFELLSTYCEVFPIKSAPHWITALQQCVRDYTRGKIAGALSLAYEQYNLYISNGITFPFSPGEFLFVPDIKRQRILRGRQLVGEPEDFDF